MQHLDDLLGQSDHGLAISTLEGCPGKQRATDPNRNRTSAQVVGNRSGVHTSGRNERRVAKGRSNRPEIFRTTEMIYGEHFHRSGTEMKGMIDLGRGRRARDGDYSVLDGCGDHT